MSLNQISETFASSPEFTANYGSLTNAAFVNLVYKNVLARPADTGGLTYWTGKLDAHSKTRGQVMVGFSESTEYKTKMQTSVDVATIFIAMFGASPAVSSFANWLNYLAVSPHTVADLANQVLAAPAYTTRVG